MVRITMEDGGVIDIELDPKAAPITCENFEKLVKSGFYDGLTFHRVDRKSTRLNSSHQPQPRMPSSA